MWDEKLKVCVSQCCWRHLMHPDRLLLKRICCELCVITSLTCSSMQAHLCHTSRLQGLVAKTGRVRVRCLPDTRPQHATAYRDFLWECSPAHPHDLCHAAHKQGQDCSVWVLFSLICFLPTIKSYICNQVWHFRIKVSTVEVVRTHHLGFRKSTHTTDMCSVHFLLVATLMV